MDPVFAQISYLPSELGPQMAETLRAVARGLLLILIAAAIALLGWAAATLLARAARALLARLGLDASVKRLAHERGVPEELLPSRLVGYVLFWTILFATSLLALRVLGIDLVPSIVTRLEDLVPRVLSAALVLVLGIPAALAASRVLNAILLPTGVKPGRFRSQAVVAVLVGFTVLLALEQLGLAAQLVLAVGIAAVAAVGLGLALAFGLGCRELARDLIVEYLRATDEERGEGRT